MEHAGLTPRMIMAAVERSAPWKNEIAAYDATGRIACVTDRNGNLAAKTDAGGYATEYAYEPLDLVSSIDHNDGEIVS